MSGSMFPVLYGAEAAIFSKVLVGGFNSDYVIVEVLQGGCF